MTTTEEDIKAGILIREASRKLPDWWIEHVLGCSLHRVQREIARSVFAKPRTTVRSCTGSGKTFIAARLALCFLQNFYPSKVITTAPTFRQVESILWREIGLAYGQANPKLGGHKTGTRLEMDDDWFALGLSTDEPERFQGFHSPNILIIGDEASGLGEKVYDAIETPMSTGNARLLYIGNPTQPVGKFRDTFDSSLYNHFTISAFDTPNFIAFDLTLEDLKTGKWKDKVGIAQWQIEDGTWLEKLPCPYLITPLWAAERLEEWGEGSFLFQVYVLGEFPKKGVKNLFDLVAVEKAVGQKVNDEGLTVASADIARYGDCETVYMLRRGEKVIKIETWSHEGIEYTTGRIARHLREDNPSVVRIDAGGIGVDDCTILENEGFNVDRVLSNEPAVDKERFANRRAELYWLLTKRFYDGKICIPDDKKLIAQLTDVQFDFSKGREIIESKENMRSRGSKSPDRADALVLLFAPDDEFSNIIPQVWRF